MKGLILKDLLNIRLYGKTLGILLLFFIVVGVLQRSITVIHSTLSFLMVFFVMMIMINSISVDSTAKWDVYALSLPVRRKDLVAGKYLLLLLLSIFGAAFMLLFSAIASLFFGDISLSEQGLIVLGVVGATWLLMAIMIPLIYKFGVEKARFVFIFIALAPTLALSLLKGLNITQPDFSNLEQYAWMLWLVPVAIVLFLYASYRISVNVYSKKDI